MKIMTVVGTRPEIIRLSRVIHELDRFAEHVLVHTGQNYDYELNEVFFHDLQVRRPDYFLEAAGETPAQTIGNVIARVDQVLAEVQPQALLVLGDTNSCLAAIAAKRRKVPVFHMEAGNRCFDQRVPEEINRRIIDHISDINLTYTEHARRYLIAEGLPPQTIIKSGSPMREVLEHYSEQIDHSNIHTRLNLKPGSYFVVSAHREENVDDPANFADLLSSLNALASHYRWPVIVSTHPRTRLRLEQLAPLATDPLISFLKPLGFFDYVKLQTQAFCVLSDSGTITEEAAILGFPAVMIRQAHERPEGSDDGNVVMCGLQAERVLESVHVVAAQQREVGGRFTPPADYEARNVSRKVLRTILSYTDYVNRTVWSRPSHGPPRQSDLSLQPVHGD